MEPWNVTARNLPEHANNLIHTDAGAQAAGYPRALVAGVTVYAYAVHLPAMRWGLDWARSGTAEVRFRAPVHDQDLVTCSTTVDEAALDVVVTVDDALRAECRFAAGAAVEPGDLRAGEAVPVVERRLVGEWDDHARRIGDDELTLFQDAGVVHPAAWPSLANGVMHQHIVQGSWIHTRSRIQHHDVAPIGATAVAESSVIERFTTRSGERAILDVHISVDGRPVATIEHEAIVRLAAG